MCVRVRACVRTKQNSLPSTVASKLAWHNKASIKPVSCSPSAISSACVQLLDKVVSDVLHDNVVTVIFNPGFSLWTHINVMRVTWRQNNVLIVIFTPVFPYGDTIMWWQSYLPPVFPYRESIMCWQSYLRPVIPYGDKIMCWQSYLLPVFPYGETIMWW